MNKFTSNDFSSRKRDFLLSYKVYEYNYDEMLEGFDIVRTSLAKPIPAGKPISLYGAAVQLKQRAWDSLAFLTNCYSAGHLVEDLTGIYPAILEYWKEFSRSWIVFQESEEGSVNKVATVALLGTDFTCANQLICFSILLGFSNELKEISSIIDFNNPGKDGMLERMLKFYVDNRGELPDKCMRHLPYHKTLKIFSAPAEMRSQLMAEYLEDWYHASRCEPYYDSHKRADQFTGYWAWEAAAISYILEIDDTSYRNAKFYPADLVDFARRINAALAAQPVPKNFGLRAKSGTVCLKSGMWETLDIPPQHRRFEQGEIMNAIDPAYGLTVWRYLST